MAQFKVPDGPNIQTVTMSNFLGVDFTSVTPNIRRASNLVNMVNENGFLESRPGFDVTGYEFGTAATANIIFSTGAELRFTSIRKSARANNITIQFVKPPRRNNKLKLTQEDGKLIYTLAVNDRGDVLTTARDIADMENYYVTCITNGNYTVEELVETNLSGGVSRRINGIWNIDRDDDEIFLVHVENKLYALDNTFSNPTDLGITVADTITQYSSVMLDNKLAVFDGNRAFFYGKDAGVWGVYYLDEKGYIPTTSINRKPDGTGASSYEDANILTPYRIESFVADGTSGVYYVSEPFDDEAPTAQIINPDTGRKDNLAIQAWDRVTGAITFATIPAEFPVAGRDSVFIRYKKTTNDEGTGENIKEYLNKCTIATSYGYNSNNTRIFVSGNPQYPEVDWFSAEKDVTYFPAENYTKVGFQPIVNYLKLNDGKLAIQKKISDTDYSIYYRDSAMYNSSEVYPIASGSKAVGCISKYANANLLNDPLTLTETGVYGVAGSSYGEKFVNERSYFVKTKLLAEPNLENAVAITHHAKYYLAVNDHVYVADGRYKSKVDEANASTYQYEWYYWEDIPVRIWFTYNDELYFATDSGDICEFNDTVLNYNIPMKQLFDTAFLDLGSIVQSKTVRRVTVITRPYEDSEYTLSYITNEDSQDIINKQTPMSSFPATLQEKEKIKKVMYVKFRLYNDTEKPMNFFKIGIEYIFSGRYRGD